MKNFEYTKEDLQEFEKLAEQGVPYGYAMLSRICLENISNLNVGIDFTKSYEYAQKAYEVDKEYINRNKEDGNTKYLKGYGYTTLGACLIDGIGTRKNEELGIKLIKEAASFGNPLGQFYLGVLYRKGLYVSQDQQKALEYFKRAAEKDQTDSLEALASYYFDAGYSKKNPTSGGFFEYFKETLAYYYTWTNSPKEPSDYEKSVQYLKKAVNLGSMTAKLTLGMFYKEGYGVDKDENKAFALFKQADASSPVVQYVIGECYKSGSGTNRDIAKAVYHLEKAAEQEYGVAQAKLGEIYCNGEALEQDLEKGVYWLIRASVNGRQDAFLACAGILLSKPKYKYVKVDNRDNRGYTAFLAAVATIANQKEPDCDILEILLSEHPELIKDRDTHGADAMEIFFRHRNISAGNLSAFIFLLEKSGIDSHNIHLDNVRLDMLKKLATNNGFLDSVVTRY